MNKKINNYIIFGYTKILLNAILLFICLGVILNLFEEIEFFKNTDAHLILPLILTFSYIPNLVFINLMPFIIFLSAMYYFISIKQKNNELLTLKVFGYSNLKIISIVSVVAFLFGLSILVIINPITSNMVKFYEQTKSNYSRDTDHLVTINRNGVWIKETQQNKLILINAQRLENNFLIDVSLDILSEDHVLLKELKQKRLTYLKIFGN